MESYDRRDLRFLSRYKKECGIACYGPEILEAVSRKNNISIDQIQHLEESVSGSFLYTLFVMGRVQSGDSDMLSGEGKIFVEEQRAIKYFAGQGPAIFLGHCAAQALKDRRGVIKVFIHADLEEKKKRIMADYHIPEREVESTRKRFDNKRSKYFYANTTRHWNDMNNYDIALDASQLGIEGCVAVLRGLF